MTRLAAFVFAACLAASPALAQPKVPPDLEKGFELFRAGKFDDAHEELKKATKANPALLPPRLILADWFVKANRGQDARLNLERAAADDPKHPDVYLINASFAFGEGRVTDAVLNLQTVLQLAADARWTAEQKKRFLLEARVGLASCLEQRGDFAGVKEALQAVLNDDPKNGGVRQRMAGAVFALNKPEDAFAELTKAFADDPAVELPELRMAYLWAAKAGAAKPDEAKADREKAEDWMKKAIPAHAKSPKPLRAYANWLLDDGRADAAAPYVEAAAKLDATGRETLALRGVLHRHKKEFAAAEAVFEQLFKDGPNDPFAIGNLAIVLAEAAAEEKQKRGINLARALVQQNQRSADAMAVLGWCELKAGRADEAERDLSAASGLGTMTLDSVYFYGRMLFEKKKYEDAQKVLKAAVEARGPFVYRSDAAALLTEAAKLAPPKKEEPKK